MSFHFTDIVIPVFWYIPPAGIGRWPPPSARWAGQPFDIPVKRLFPPLVFRYSSEIPRILASCSLPSKRFMRWPGRIWLPFSTDAVPGLPALGRRSSVLGLLQPYSRSRQTSPKQYLIRTVIQLEKETLPSLSIPIWTGQILRFLKKFLKTFSEPLIRGQRVKGRNLLPSLPIPFWTA